MAARRLSALLFTLSASLAATSHPLGAADAATPMPQDAPAAESQSSPPRPEEPAAQPTASGPLTVSEVLADVLSWGPSLSPSGRYLAVLKQRGSRSLIVIADLQDESAKPFVYPVPIGRVKWVAWVSDDRLIYATKFWIGQQLRLRGRYNLNLTRTFAIDRDGKNAVALLSDNDHDQADLGQVTALLPNDSKHVVMPVPEFMGLSLFLVDVDTGKSRRIAKGNPKTLFWFTDREGFPAFRVDRNWLSTLAYVYVRKGPGNVPAENLQWERAYSVRLRGKDNDTPPDFYPLRPGPEPNTFYVAARPDGADTSGVYLYDFATKKFLKTLAAEPGVDIDEVFADDYTGEYIGVRYYADRKVMRMANPRVQAHLDALDKYFGGEVDVYLKGFDRNFETWLLYTIGPRDRGSWHVYRLKDRYVREVAHLLPVLDAKRLGTTKVVRYQARDGLEIMGYLTTPPTARAGTPPPLIMLPHGGPEARDNYHFNAWVQLLASRGYEVFQPNFRGSSGFGKRFADAGKRQWGGAMQDDLTDGFEFLVKNGYAARDRACIVGASYGGYAALAAATQTPDLYRCAVSIAGVSDLPKQLEFEKRATEDNDEAWGYWRRQIGDPEADQAMLEAHSPARLAAAVKIPILLIHGKDDTTVPIEQSEMMQAALNTMGKDVRLLALKNTGHALEGEGEEQTLTALLEFLQARLPVAPGVAETAAAPATPAQGAAPAGPVP